PRHLRRRALPLPGRRRAGAPADHGPVIRRAADGGGASRTRVVRRAVPPRVDRLGARRADDRELPRHPFPRREPRAARGAGGVMPGAERPGTWCLRRRTLPLQAPPDRIFTALYGRRSGDAVWLDSAVRAYGMGRFSIMG